jgi:DNA helicase-2/ATP-dependent DNA helicase PcrA
VPPALRDPEQLKELLGIPFTAEQLDAITADLAPGVIVAGAGSGKTTVMTARVVWLVGTGAVRPDQVLGLTFTNKAAGELAERVRAALRHVGTTRADAPPAGEEETGEPTVSTYHSFAGRLLQEHGLRIGLEPSARLLADATRFQLAARSARRAPGPFPTLTGTLASVSADVLTLAGEMAEHLVHPDELAAFDEEFVALAEAGPRPSAAAREAARAARARLDLVRLVAAYRDAKSARDLLDFGDQIALAARLAEERPEVGEILRDTYRVVLLDEYQDTSVAQRRFLAGLFGRPQGAATGHGHPVTAVGDPCQAIYGWRGASVDNLLSFHEHFPPAPGAPGDGPGRPRDFRLGENRRSGGRILAFANDLAADLPERRDGVVVPLRPADGAENDGWARCALLPTYHDEIAWIADQVRHVLDTAYTGKGERVAPRDIAVLARTAADFADIHAALVARDVPVEVVGLSGLLHLPEVADLVAMCEVLDDPTANTALVRLLAGPRWRIGARDLALLGRRAAELVRVERGAAPTPDARLAEAVAGVDPTEVVSLSDALDDLGPGPFSAQARRRFERLASEIRHLRAHLGEPLMDVLHRVLVVTGLDVELSASPHALAARRRETLYAFLDIAAGFADLDGDPSLTAFLAFLRTAAEHDNGLDGSLPSAGDSVKVLTAHRSKGLEWAVVAVPGLVDKVFPSARAADRWTRTGRALPHPLRGDRSALPVLGGLTAKDFKAFDAAMKEHRHIEEIRLGYVTFTRPKDLLIASGHWWGRTQKLRRGPSEFLDRLREHCEAGHGEVVTWAPEPDEARNPHLDDRPDHAWPLPLDPDALAARRRAARMVLEELDRRRGETGRAPAGEDTPPGAGPAVPRGAIPAQAAGGPGEEERGNTWDPAWPAEPPEDDGWWDEEPEEAGDEWSRGGRPAGAGAAAPRGTVPAQGSGPGACAPAADDPAPAAGADLRLPEPSRALDPADRARVRSWDADLTRLADELRRNRSGVREVELPLSLSASQMLRLASDPDGLAREIARPMPRPPAPAARRGTRFHAWVEAQFDQQPLLDPDDLPGAADEEIDDEADLVALQEAFGRTPYARRAPYRVEAPFQLILGGRVVRGRIDAVYRGADGRYEVVDWKTGRAHTADPLQLAVYRLAWAEAAGVDPDEVTATFLYVRTGEIVRPTGLPDRQELERLLADGPG